MKDKIALEEHFAIDLTIEQSRIYARPGVWEKLRADLLDVEQQRLERMEESGTAFSILSLNAPGTQGIPDPAEAIDVARRANDALAAFVSRHPQRLGGFAALPMQDPDAAARELERSVRDLGFHGFLVNGFTQLGDPDTIVYYDDPRFDDFWKTVEDLGKPFYLHPRDPLPINARAFQGFPWLGAPTWAFAVETSTHALRLVTSGLFDRYPRLQMILGHMGECIPFHIWRIDHVLQIAPRGSPAQRPVSAYLRDNVHITTSGVFHTPAMLLTMLTTGSDRILFSVDYPFEVHAEAANWFDSCEISELDRRKIGRDNARRLFGLP
jgi:predicted TIM-barrel fold metal-dependent hydrolase